MNELDEVRRKIERAIQEHKGEDLLDADEEEIAHAIRIGGLSRQKSRVITSGS